MVEHLCPDCQIALTPITVIDQVNGNILNSGFAFTLDKKVKTNMWKGGLKNQAGVINGYLCPNCSRVLFYATSNKKH